MNKSLLDKLDPIEWRRCVRVASICMFVCVISARLSHLIIAREIAFHILQSHPNYDDDDDSFGSDTKLMRSNERRNEIQITMFKPNKCFSRWLEIKRNNNNNCLLE